MNNLVIGKTSQLSHYFPDDYIKISSRDIDFNYLMSKDWDSVFICIGESRKFLDDIKIYDDVNFYLTLDIIDKLKNISRKIIVYSTCELWNQYDGPINISMSFNFFSTPYLKSKYKLSKYLIQNSKEYYNVFILYPFNFNSIYRNDSFLFGKIFDSIVNKKTIEIGDTYFYRDIIHPSFVVKESINSYNHKIIGSGRIIFVNDFIRALYNEFNMIYEDYVIENIDKYNEYDKRKEYYLSSNICLHGYKQLLDNTIEDINKLIR
jgi:nucleoside-diphosphate-sugar epimerase